MKIWIGRNGESYGPFRSDTTRRWLEEGKLVKDDSAWDLENERWVALVDLLDRLEGGASEGVLAKEEDHESKAAKIRELLVSRNEDLALDILLGDPCPRLFETLIKDLGTWRIGEDRKFDCRNRFEFELLVNCPEEAEIPESFGTETLKIFSLNSSWITKPEAFKCFSSLRKLALVVNDDSDLSFLVHLPGLVNLTLNCRGSEFSDLGVLSPLENLEELFVSGADNLISLEPLRNMKKIRALRLSGCSEIESLDPLGSCPDLEELDLSGSGKGFVQVDPIGSLVKLEKVSLSGWADLESLDGLENLVNLKEIDLNGCEGIDRLDPLYELKFLELLKGTLNPPWSSETFVFMVETKADLSTFRDQVDEQEDGPELMEEMLSCFSQLNSKAIESMSYESFNDLVYFAFSCAEKFNLKGWYTGERGELSRQAYWLLADCAGDSVRKYLRVADFNNGQYYCDQLLARSCIDRAIEAFDEECQDEEILGHFIRACTENDMYPDAIPLFCAKMKTLNLDEYVWDLTAWPDEFEFDGYELSFPPLADFSNLEELSTNGLSEFPDELANLNKLKRLNAWSFAGEKLELPSGLESLEEIDLESSEQLKTLGDLSAFRSLKSVNLWGCDQLERPDWLSKIDSETLEICLPDHLEEPSN